MTFKHVFILPVILFLHFSILFTILFVIGITNNHIKTWLPFVSCLGMLSPERGIFTMTMTVGALLFAVTICVRYGQIKFIAKANNQESKIKKFNFIALIMGLVASFNAALLGCFSLNGDLIAHVIFTLLAFLAAEGYLCTQVWISSKLFTVTERLAVNNLRIIFAVLDVVTSILVPIFTILALYKFPDALRIENYNILTWTSEQDGYYLYLAASCCEWIHVFSVICFVSSFTFDFKNVVILEPVVSHREISP